MHVLPARLVDALPPALWAVGNLRLGGRLHFYYGGGAQRTVEWQGREIASGATMRLDEMEGHSV